MEPTPTDPWYRRATLYHIYPLSFADSNGDGYGDLRGIIDHLDYLNNGESDSLGVTAVWLSPVYLSPMADWGYDVADHQAIDPRFGTMADFEELLKKLHHRGIKLLMDYVPNHTSVLHRWFIQSRSSRDNPKRDWYVWSKPGEDGGAPNNWLSYFGGSAWTLDEATGQYYLHTFLQEQPDLNWHNPKVRKAMLAVLRFWLDKGVDGFRTDAALGLIKDVRLRDDLPNPTYKPGVSDPADEFLRVNSAAQPELGGVIGSFCDVLAEKESKFLLSEAYLNIPGLHKMYEACQRHPVHAPFNFNLMALDWSAKVFREFIDEYEGSLGPDDWPNYVLGNHDRHRLVSRMGAGRARLLAMLQLTLRGLPVVYYGEELGLPDTPVTPEDVRDPWERNVPGRGLGRDPERTPLPWNNETGGGFTTGTPWLPLGPASSKLNVATEERDPDSSLNLYRHLIHLRAQSPALVEGDYRSIETGNERVYAFVRETEQQRFLVMLNFDAQPATAMLHGRVGAWVAGTVVVEGDGQPGHAGELALEPYEGRVYELIRGGV
ncbi:MAG TPA: alpha-amylase family glycosyl hydrolase [Candidatus Saccharimonadia bacterium]|nr:alpha-amylase family glycosyl hydrolase [Candidatus Saccharimonadia bacterium]